MYCSSCGVDSVEGLRYCKRCGATLAGGLEGSSSGKLPIPITIAFLLVIALAFCVGLALPLAAAQDLVRIGFTTNELMTLFMADLCLTLIVVGMLVWLLLRLTRPIHRLFPGTAVEISDDPVRPQISAPPQSIGSVTENTTRTLEQRKYDRPQTLG